MDKNNNENKRKKRKGNKRIPKWIKILVITIISLILVCAIVILIVYNNTIGKMLNNIKHEELNKDDLAVNEDLYKDVSEKVNKEEFDKIVNIAFFGSDSRDVNDETAGRSDSIMIVSINPVKKSIKLISIPRDTYVNVPNGYGWTKINHAYAYGQEQLSLKTINSNFGLDITEYATIDFSGLANIINEVGGIELKITEAEKYYINTRNKEAYIATGNPVEYVERSGYVTLTGEQALTHSRNRDIGDDFGRASRQRDVLTALIAKIASMDQTKIFSLINDFLKEVKTNINVENYFGLLTSIVTQKDVYLNNIISTQIPSIEYGEDRYIDGIYYFAADLDKCKQDFRKYLYDM